MVNTTLAKTGFSQFYPQKVAKTDKYLHFCV